ncbi:ABC transporter ATP-binding protein [Natrinema halophilum]|uniref:ATP-binding cassette domain-containing protein n=1 Tax=Natrinema halophilum TaxID=1699371 RepID=A0A7D5L3G9_9EURY|nr:ABC transporter ATP-binding protein [Natrinema halophilum]QLG49825.1 energy-coupling factor ABC transporter ATP-binding protein [Natrinema halophilum]
MSLIEYDNVNYSYRSQTDEQAIEDVSLSIEKGEFVGITGAADAGKSTLARMIPGYIPNFFEGEFEGNVTVDGANTRETSIGDLSTKVGMLFENPFDQMTGASTTVFEEVAFALENQGIAVPEMVERVKWSLELVGIEDLYQRNPNQLSGGQSQRVALASILALRPDILILDEPTSQLDPEGTESVFEVIGNLDRDEFTIVLVSQKVERLAPHIDRMVVVEDGQIAHNGDPKDVLATLATQDSKISVPTQISVGKWLRDNGFVSTEKQLPVTYQDALSELQDVYRAEGLLASDDATPEISASSGTEAISDSAEDSQLTLDSVTYRYSDTVEALTDISTEFDHGVVCLIGQNGAGKTTFAKHLNALLTPSEGTVTVRGKNTRDHRVAEMAKDVGLSFQNPNDQLFHDSIDEEVRYGPKNIDLDADTMDENVDDAIDRLNLNDVRERNPYDIGQARRKHVAVASVLAMDSPIFVLDEPTGGQDADGAELLGSLIEEMADAGKLIIVITHDVDFAARHSDRVIALRQGELLLDGPPEEVFNQPEELQKTNVDLPTVTQLSLELGHDTTVLTIDELLDKLRRDLDVPVTPT